MNPITSFPLNTYLPCSLNVVNMKQTLFASPNVLEKSSTLFKLHLTNASFWLIRMLNDFPSRRELQMTLKRKTFHRNNCTGACTCRSLHFPFVNKKSVEAAVILPRSSLITKLMFLQWFMFPFTPGIIFYEILNIAGIIIHSLKVNMSLTCLKCFSSEWIWLTSPELEGQVICFNLFSSAPKFPWSDDKKVSSITFTRWHVSWGQ